VIRQRESAVPGERAEEVGQPVASIAPDGLEAFARDLRALRAKAGLDYEEMAEVSHYTMKTLASAAGGLRLPTLPVAVAYVRACNGDVAEWEERWQKLAAKITAEAARKRKSDGEQQGPPEPAELAAVPEPPALGPAPAAQAAHPPEPEGSGPGGEVYVITSAKPRPPAW
jgi:transcriptional regulator with XRE-family HTH domain